MVRVQHGFKKILGGKLTCAVKKIPVRFSGLGRREGRKRRGRRWCGREEEGEGGFGEREGKKEKRVSERGDGERGKRGEVRERKEG